MGGRAKKSVHWADTGMEQRTRTEPSPDRKGPRKLEVRMGVRHRAVYMDLYWVLIGSALFKAQTQGRVMVWPFLITTSFSQARVCYINK